MKFVFAATLSLALSAGAALAQPSPPPAAASAPAVSDKPKHGSLDEVICRRPEVTGSMMAKPVCMTRRDWRDAEGTDAQADTVLLHRQPLQPDN